MKYIDKSIIGISQKTIHDIYKEWEEIGNPKITFSPDIDQDSEELDLKEKMNDCILEKGGDYSNNARIVELGLIYLNCTINGKIKFLSILSREFDIDTDYLNEKILKLKTSENDKELISAELELRNALIPPRYKLLKQFIKLPNGFIFLRDMREDLLPFSKNIPRLKKLDGDLKNMLVSFFDISFLDLSKISWNSPAALLEKLIEYESVHEIGSWNNLKHRLHTDRKIFAFMHHKIPNDPLVFVEVALVNGISDSIQKLLDVKSPDLNPHDADTAIFYSISSTQKGLKGINFGNFLIKRVVKEINKELPNIKNFSTLSPIPTFRKWVEKLELDDDRFFTGVDLKKMKKSERKEPIKSLLNILKKNNKRVEVIKVPLMRMVSHYLLNEKRGEKALDPVANFHLRNGAKVYQLNWMGDTSEKGMKQSYGIMVNYYYELNKIVENHEKYVSDNKISATKNVRDYLKK